MIDVAATPRDVRRRRHAREGAEFTNQVRLVVKSAVGRDAAPFDVAAAMDAIDDRAESLQACITFWTHADVFAEQTAETARRHVKVAACVADASHARRVLEQSGSVRDRQEPYDIRRDISKPSREQRYACARIGGFEQALAQVARAGR